VVKVFNDKDDAVTAVTALEALARDKRRRAIDCHKTTQASRTAK
jgi:hypothetical protein